MLVYRAGELTADSTEQYETPGVSPLSLAEWGKCCLNFLTKTPASDTVKGLPGYPVQNCPSSFPEGHPEVVCTVTLDLSFMKMKMLLCLKYSKN